MLSRNMLLATMASIATISTFIAADPADDKLISVVRSPCSAWVGSATHLHPTPNKIGKEILLFFLLSLII